MANQKRVMVPFQALLAYGVAVDAVCPGKKAGDVCRTAIHQLSGHQTYSESRGHNFALNATFDEIEAAKYDGLFITGGRAPEYLAMNESYVVRGRKCTAFLSEAGATAGAHWERPKAFWLHVVSMVICHSSTYEGHPEFIRLFVKALGGSIVGSGKRILFLWVPQALECLVDAVCPKKPVRNAPRLYMTLKVTRLIVKPVGQEHGVKPDCINLPWPTGFLAAAGVLKGKIVLHTLP
ncbi:hypothetical protein HAX54_007754 [Datura stramonium]|uniref:DJ-1/PfpI domain-containing protein n=1 Tax=Datura stramonium TaxID=4076 RepID=A0ABS8RHZ6_DATST|nr:hypothetical protein [Datura stramonium]